MSVANQNSFIINKPPVEHDFLQVADIDWIYAKRDLTYSSFAVFLYLSSNKNGYRFEYSPQAIANTGLMSKGTATKARQELEAKGYIIDNVFYVRPPKHVQEMEAKRNSPLTADDI